MQVFEHVGEATKWLEKANAELQPELLTAAARRELLARYARLKKLAGFGETQLAGAVEDASEIARITGTSIGKAKRTVETARVLHDADLVREALKIGEVSFDQAAEVATAERACPGSSAELLQVARDESFHVLKDRSRKVVLEAERHRGLAERQREARSSRSYSDDLGMVNIHLRMTPTLGTAIVNRAEAEGRRLQRQARRKDRAEPFERHLADAYGALLSGADTKARPRRPELVVLVSHEVAARGWSDVRPGELCKIPGVGPVAPEEAKELARDAFLSGLFYDGVDLRNLKRWTRNVPVEVRIALELGDPPEFDGVACVDCGNRFRPESDHDLEPHCDGGPASTDNLKWRCHACHKEKTERDRKAGKFRPQAKRGPPQGPSV